MDDARKWTLAWSRFEAFRNHPPNWWDEEAVSQFHQIVTALEEASGEDLSSFRVPDSEMKQKIIAVSPATRRRPGSKTMSEKRYCDEQYMRRQIEGIASYVHSLQPPPEPPPAPPKYGF
jgi:hypothetical protein